MALRREQEIEEDVVLDDGTKKPLVDKNDNLEVEDDLEDDNDDIPVPKGSAAAPKKPAPVSEDADDLEDTRIAYDLEDDGQDDRGASRRARRNRSRRERSTQDAQTIAAMAGQIAELRGAVDSMSRGQIGLAASDLDGQIRQVHSHLQTVDAAFAKAVKDGDGETIQRAMSLRDEARDRLADLGVAKRRLAYEAQNGGARLQPNTQGQPQNQNGGPQKDPVADRFAEKFMDRHPWFDPENPTDEDSQIVKSIDSVLWSEGYRPNTKLYWVELESRVRARGIGEHNDGGDDVTDDTDNDVQPQRRPVPRVPGRPPTAGGRGGARRPAGTGFKLDAFMTQTLDDLGLTDPQNLTKEQLTQRRKYVAQWKSGMEAARAAGKL